MSIATELTRLNTNKEALATAKTAIASAITTKGGTVGIGDGFEDFPADIASIPSGGGGVGYDTGSILVTSDTLEIEVNNLTINPRFARLYCDSQTRYDGVKKVLVFWLDGLFEIGLRGRTNTNADGISSSISSSTFHQGTSGKIDGSNLIFTTESTYPFKQGSTYIWEAFE